ncbi:coiled-coil domain-containing protein 124-A-like [Watersipora subatra]|uniref:coiled-coil domain-containing protein 124-A-like n=1 Tax=Watersipora subatra TaxID=2589382 RepID=UPI00355BFC83
MPKKFKGENSKATEARAKKAAVQHEAEEQRRKDAEDALWVDDDKQLARKSQRKDDKEKKRLEQLERKRELAKLHDEEQNTLKSGKPKAPTKVTRHEINKQAEAREAAEASRLSRDNSISVPEEELVENINRLEVEGEARSVDAAIGILSKDTPELDRHPEKRMKAAYQEFESRRLPILKAENSNLRLSQLKQMLKKEWQKSPENPLNARLLQ